MADKISSENLRRCQILRNVGVKLKPCPFCGEDVNDYPLVMTLRPLYSEEYLLAKLNKGHFLGGENGWAVMCPRCCGQGSRDTDVILAVNKWNQRHKMKIPLDDLYGGYHVLFRDDMNRIATTEKPMCCQKCGLEREEAAE